MPIASAFDPYREWLGIEPHEQPADYYRLLGIARFEADPRAIAAAADERMAHVRSFLVGPRGMYTQRLLNEIAAARVTLITPQSRAAYDAALVLHRPPPAAAALAAFAPHFAAPGWPPSDPPVEAPPVLPPAVPPPIAALPDTASANVTAPSPWRLLLVLVALPTMLLLAVIAWAISKPYLDDKAIPEPDKAATDSIAQPPRLPPKAAPTPIIVLQEGSGEVLLTPATAAPQGPVELAVSGTEEVLIDWHAEDAAAEWRFRLVKPGFFHAEVTYATREPRADAELELIVGEKSSRISLRFSGGPDQFIADQRPIVVPKSGENTLRIRPVNPQHSDWLLLKSVRLVPALRNVPAKLEE
jgi:hypothetical protein